MKKWLMILTFITILLGGCDNFTFFGLIPDVKTPILEVSFNINGPVDGFPSYPFLPSDAASIEVKVMSLSDDEIWIEESVSTIDLTNASGMVSARFKNLPSEMYDIWVSSYDSDAGIRSFGSIQANIKAGDAYITPLMGPAVAAFKVDGTDSSGAPQTIEAKIEGPHIFVNLPDENFTITGLSADCSQGSDNDFRLFVTAFPEGGGRIEVDSVAGFSLDSATGTVNISDYALFSSALGSTGDFVLQTMALNSDTIRKPIGWTDYFIDFSYPGELELERTEAPVISPEGGIVQSPIEITLTAGSEGASSWYTDDGSNPGPENRTEYTGSLTYSEDVVFRAYSTMIGRDDSIIVSEDYHFDYQMVESPVFTPAGNNYTSIVDVEISSDSGDAEIRYTLDGSEPSRTHGSIYDGTIRIESTTTIKAMAWKEGMSDSDTVTVSYGINIGTLTAPLFSLPGGTYTGNQVVTFSAEVGASIYYTTDGSEPDESDTLYIGVLSITENTTLKAVATLYGRANSPVSTVDYQIRVADPLFSAESGSYEFEKTITLSSATAGAEIRYTTDGSEPSRTDGLVYSATPIDPLEEDTTIKAMAWKDGLLDSDVVTGVYTIYLIALIEPVLSLTDGIYSDTQTVSILAEIGASIYYTTDGTEPDESDILYGTAVSITQDTTFKAIAVKYGRADSPVATGMYQIQVASPVFSIASGTYDPGQAVTISCPTPGAEIRYTTDGSEPSRTVGMIYPDTLIAPLDFNTNIKAIAWKEGMTDSMIMDESFLIRSGIPGTDLVAGIFTASMSFNVSPVNPPAVLRYEVTGDMTVVPTVTDGVVSILHPDASNPDASAVNIDIIVTAEEPDRAVSNPMTIFGCTLTPALPDNVVVVDGSIGTAGDGRTWQGAMDNLQAAIEYVDVTPGYDEVWVKEGVYVPDVRPNGEAAGNPRTVYFALRDNLSLVGGFAGDEWRVDQRIPNLHETVLSGDIDGDDIAGVYGVGYTINNTADNAYHVFRINNPTPLNGAMIDGFIITGGAAEFAGEEFGGGMWIEDTGIDSEGLIISNSVFSRNLANSFGGAVYMDDTTFVTFVNVIFEGNIALDSGGAVFLESNMAAGNFMNTVFFGNYAANKGGGIMWNGAGGIMNNAVFISNYVGNEGQALVYSPTTQFISNIISWDNTGGGTDIAFVGAIGPVYNSMIQAPGGYNDEDCIDYVNEPGSTTRFIDTTKASGDDGIWFNGDDGYIIRPGSTAKDLGRDPDLPDLLDLDDDGDSVEPYPYDIFFQDRVGEVDAGVFELP